MILDLSIIDYIGSSDLPIVKDRLIREGSEYSNETMENAESTLSTENNEGENGDETTNEGSCQIG